MSFVVRWRTPGMGVSLVLFDFTCATTLGVILFAPLFRDVGLWSWYTEATQLCVMCADLSIINPYQTSMHPIQELINEHVAISRMLRVLFAVSDRLEKGEKVDPVHLERMVDFIRVFADKCHHGKEEGIFFGASKNTAALEEDYVEVLLSEHKLGREHVRLMAVGIEELKETGNGRAFAKSAKSYVRLLNHHIAEENAEYFPLVKEHLSEERAREMEEAFKEIERQVIGEGVHEQLQKTLKEFEVMYLAD